MPIGKEVILGPGDVVLYGVRGKTRVYSSVSNSARILNRVYHAYWPMCAPFST